MANGTITFSETSHVRSVHSFTTPLIIRATLDTIGAEELDQAIGAATSLADERTYARLTKPGEGQFSNNTRVFEVVVLGKFVMHRRSWEGGVPGRLEGPYAVEGDGATVDVLAEREVKAILKDVKRVYPDYDSKDGYEIAGFAWFQGWNDMVDSGTYPTRGEPGGYASYSNNLAHFIRDVRRDLKAPKLPFVIGVMGAGGPIAKYGPDQKRYAGIHGGFRKAMAAPAKLPEFKGNVAAVFTENYWDGQLSELVDRRGQINTKPVSYTHLTLPTKA